MSEGEKSETGYFLLTLLMLPLIIPLYIFGVITVGLIRVIGGDNAAAAYLEGLSRVQMFLTGR